MPEPTAFDRILGRLSDSDGVTEKTASEEPTPNAEAAMLDTVRRVSEAHVKTASAEEPTPATNLENMAKAAAVQEEENLIKQAQHMGSVMCDSFFERFAAYDTALEGQSVKQGAVTIAPGDTALAAAKAEGKKEAAAELEVQAQGSFNKGYEDTMQQIYKTAAEIHYQGQATARQLLNESKQA